MCVHPYIKEINGVLTPLPCGRCPECLRRYSQDYDFRLRQELKDTGVFWYVTLTYNDTWLPQMTLDGVTESAVIVSEVQNFLKRLRKRLGSNSVRYFAVGEYGKNNRAHYHLLLFTKCFRNVHDAYLKVLECWSPRGFVYVKFGLVEHFHYLTKYVNKLDLRPHWSRPFKLMSKGLGLSFLSSNMVHWLMMTHQRVVFRHDGCEMPLPRYYVKKLNELTANDPLSWSEYALIKTGCPKYKTDNIRWYHNYFCDNYDEIRELFIEAELENSHITKFLNPRVNDVFDWFLYSNPVTNSVIRDSNAVLEAVKIKNNSKEHDQPIGAYIRLPEDKLDFD